MSTQFNRRRPGVWIALFALAVFSLPFSVAALQHEPPPPVTDSIVDQPPAQVTGEVLEGEAICPKAEDDGEEREKPEPAEATACPAACPAPEATACPTCDNSPEAIAAFATGTPTTEVIYRKGLQKMLDHPDEYLGKTVTVDGEMHRQFNDRVFTIQQKGWGTDLLVITLVPMNESVIPLEDSFETHKDVRMTGVLRPYDQAQLECLFGPLNTESREGHSFTKNPVLIIGYRPPEPVAAVITPEPAPAPPEPVAAAPIEEEVEEVEEVAILELPPAPAELPKTAGDLPFVGLTGLAALLASLSVHFFRRAAARNQ